MVFTLTPPSLSSKSSALPPSSSYLLFSSPLSLTRNLPLSGTNTATTKSEREVRSLGSVQERETRERGEAETKLEDSYFACVDRYVRFRFISMRCARVRV